jgi:hypothetical protein
MKQEVKFYFDNEEINERFVVSFEVIGCEKDDLEDVIFSDEFSELIESLEEKYHARIHMGGYYDDDNHIVDFTLYELLDDNDEIPKDTALELAQEVYNFLNNTFQLSEITTDVDTCGLEDDDEDYFGMDDYFDDDHFDDDDDDDEDYFDDDHFDDDHFDDDDDDV